MMVRISTGILCLPEKQLITYCIMDEVFLTEKLPNVNTCPSTRRTAVWLLPAVTCTLGPGSACTRVGEPLARRNI